MNTVLRTICTIIATVIILLTHNAMAQKRIDGHVAVEIDAPALSSVSADVIGRLQFETKRKRNVKAVIDAEAAAYAREVVPKEIYIDYKPTKQWKTVFGYTKKVIGFEYEHDKEERLFIHRTPIYQKMEELGLVGRQITLGLRFRPTGKKNSTTFKLNIGTDQSRNYNVSLSFIYPMGDVVLAAWLLLEQHRINDEHIGVMADSMALAYEPRSARLAIELFHGIDSQRTEFERTFVNGHTVNYAGSKLEMAIHFATANHLRLSPMFYTSFWLDDLGRRHENTIAIGTGMQFKVRRLTFSANGEAIGVNDVDRRRHFDRKSLYGQFIYFF